jgi:hypothetical protein
VIQIGEAETDELLNKALANTAINECCAILFTVSFLRVETRDNVPLFRFTFFGILFIGSVLWKCFVLGSVEVEGVGVFLSRFRRH